MTGWPDALQEDHVASLLAHAGLSPLDLTQTFDNYDPCLNDADNAAALEACRRFAENFYPGCGKGLLLWGPPGVGKGHLASASIQTVIHRGIRARKYKIPWLLAKFRRLFEGDIVVFLEEVLEIPLLWLDELCLDAVGSEYEEKRAFESLYMIVDGAIERENGLILTTNYAPAALGERLARIDPTGRLLDRLRGCLEPVEIRGVSARSRVRRRNVLLSTKGGSEA